MFSQARRLLINLLSNPASAASVPASFPPVCVRHADARHRARVASQEQEGDVAHGGDQVDQHGHADGSQRRQLELLHQQAAHEDAQTRTRNGKDPCGRICSINRHCWLSHWCVCVCVCESTDPAAGWLRWW